MATPSQAALRSFVRRHTALEPVPDVPGMRLHMGDDVMALCRLVGRELGEPDPDLPYWGFAWAGGLAIARYLLDHPAEVAGRRVLDLAAGSGVCGIAALGVGAASVLAIDVDPFAEAAVGLNARANGMRIAFRRDDPLDGPPPACDVILAGDVCYEETMARRMVDWLRQAANDGVRVLVGDPGRTYLPADFERVATYRVRTSLELEDSEVKESAVLAVPAQASGQPSSGRRGHSSGERPTAA